MAITITNPNAAAYDPVSVASGVYHIRAYLPGGSVTLTSLDDVDITTGLLVTIPTGDQALIEPYTGEIGGYPVSPVDMTAQTNGVLTLKMRARRDTVATDLVINDQDIIAVLVDDSPAVVPTPDPTGVPGPQGPAGPAGSTGPAADPLQLFDASSTAASATKTTTTDIRFIGESNGVTLGDSAKNTSLVVGGGTTTCYSDAFVVTGVSTLDDVTGGSASFTNLTVSAAFNPTTVTTDSVTLNTVPTALTHATTKQYVDNAVAAVEIDLTGNTFVEKTGDTMSGTLNFSAGEIIFGATSSGTQTESLGTVVGNTVDTVELSVEPTNLTLSDSIIIDGVTYSVTAIDYVGKEVTVSSSTWSNDTWIGYSVTREYAGTVYSGLIQGVASSQVDTHYAASQGYVDVRVTPAGGTVGQFVRKTSSTDFDSQWATIAIADVDTLQTELDAKAASADMISKATLQSEVAASTDFADFQSRIAAL